MRVATIMLLAALAAGCGGGPGSGPSAPEPVLPAGGFEGRALAVVDGEAVPEEVLQAYLRMRGQLEVGAEGRDAALRDLADLVMLAQHARDTGLLDRTSVRAELAVQEVSWIANQALARYAEANPVTDEEIRRAYAEQVQRTGQTEYRIRHLLAASEGQAAALIDRLDGGESFDAVTREHVRALGPSAGGDLGWVNLAQVPAAFAPAVSELTPGRHTAVPVRSEYGWHVIRLEDRRAFTPPELAAVEEGIRATLARRKVEAYLAELRELVDVELRAP